MRLLLKEILEIPSRAEECYKKNKKLVLPQQVPYLGMGSSYFAPLTLFYCGFSLQPHLASEYYHYLSPRPLRKGVLISQSGESSDVLWNLKRFKEVVAITNNRASLLASAPQTKKLVELHAGIENGSSTKTYINTLISLYLGFGVNPKPALERLKKIFYSLKRRGQDLAGVIFHYLKSHKVKGWYVLGSGPNIGTAGEGALALSETTKLAWTGLPVALYDHGPKETANNSVVIFLKSRGPDAKRQALLQGVLRKHSNALILEIEETVLPETLSPLTLVTQIYLVMNYLADHLKIKETYQLGGKVTTVPERFR